MKRVFAIVQTSDSWGGKPIKAVFATRELAEQSLSKDHLYDLELFRRYGTPYHEEVLWTIKKKFGDEIMVIDEEDEKWYDKVLDREVDVYEMYDQLSLTIVEVDFHE